MQTPIERMQIEFRDSFMQPEVFQGRDIAEDLINEGIMYVEDDSYYCRLSASGFLDCTDYSGPFDSLDDCAEHLIAMYGTG